MGTNYLIIVVAGVLAMVVGTIWYGPFFGKKWMEITGATALDIEARKEMQKKAMPLYGIQFVLTLLQVYVLTNLITWTGGNGIGVAVWMWLGFVMPTIAGSAMWNNDSTQVKWARFGIQTGYQLVVFVLFGWMIGMWGG